MADDRERLLLLAQAKMKMERENQPSTSDQPAPSDASQGLANRAAQSPNANFYPDSQSVNAPTAAVMGAADAMGAKNLVGIPPQGLADVGAEPLQGQQMDQAKAAYQGTLNQAEAEHPTASLIGQGIGQVPAMVAGEQVPASQIIEKATVPLKSLGEMLSASAAKSGVARLGMSVSALKDAGVDKLEKLGQYLMNEGLSNVPGATKTLSQFAGLAKRLVNNNLDTIVENLDKATPEVARLSKSEFLGLGKAELEKAAGPFADKGPIQTAIDKISTASKDIPDDTKLAPSQIREWAQTIEKETGKYTKASSPAELSVKDNLQQLAGKLRGVNHQYAERAGMGEEFANASEQSQLAGMAHDALQDKAAKEFSAGPSSSSLYGSAKNAVKSAVGSAPVVAKEGMSKIINMALKDRLGKFGSTILEAANRGAAAVGAAHYVLQQSNPEYKRLWDEQNAKDAAKNQE